jgi:hypothetical protein
MFTSPLILQSEDDRPDFWYVRAPLIWCDPSWGRIEVPVGFRTDLASIPRMLRNLPALDPDGKSRRPAVVHDWLYAWQALGKDRADDFLRYAMIAEGVPHVDAETIYEAVHLFGETAYKGDGAATLESFFESRAAFVSWAAIQP